MNKCKQVWIGIVVFAVISMTVCPSVQGSEAKKADIKAPVITLNYVEVAHYWGWWYYSKKIEPTKGTKGDYGAPLDMAFIFEIQNPNAFPVKMDEFKFTVGFDDFDVNTINTIESQWIPAGKTNQLRVHSLIDARQTLLSLMVTGGFKLKDKGVSAFDQLEKWWTGAPEFAFPVKVKAGAAVFSSDQGGKVVPFKATFPE